MRLITRVRDDLRGQAGLDVARHVAQHYPALAGIGDGASDRHTPALARSCVACDLRSAAPGLRPRGVGGLVAPHLHNEALLADDTDHEPPVAPSDRNRAALDSRAELVAF